MDIQTPPAAFSFAVTFAGEDGPVTGFQEVSGLDTKIETTAVVEGGENRFVHKLPKAAKPPNIILKRGMALNSSPLVTWCKSVIEGDLTKPIQPKDLIIALRNEMGDPMMQWRLSNAYPVKWTVGGFDAKQNELAIETIELACSGLDRST